jgi:hypothetical protein
MIVIDSDNNVIGWSFIKIELNDDGHIVCWTGDETWYALAGILDYTLLDVNIPDINKVWKYINGEFIDITPPPFDDTLLNNNII